MAPDTISIQTSVGAVNPITAEIIRHGFLSIPNQIDVNITRTAYSPLVYEYKDYAFRFSSPMRSAPRSLTALPSMAATASSRAT